MAGSARRLSFRRRSRYRSPMPPSAPPVVSRPVEAVAAITEQPTDVAPPVVLWFDHLLGNQIPILEERAEFPHDIALQGRIISPPVFRVDDAAKRTIQGPHFAAVRQPEQSEPPVRSKPTTAVPSQRATERVIGELDMPHKDGPGRPHFMRRPAGKNTVAAAAASVAAAKGPSAELKQSDTPVTDALRHLQGGQP